MVLVISSFNTRRGLYYPYSVYGNVINLRMKIVRTIKHPGAMTILVTACDLDTSQLCQNYNVIQWSETVMMPKNVLIQEIGRVQGLLCLLRDSIDEEVLQASKNLKVISTLSVGYDHIDLSGCKQRGIIVTNTPDVLTEATAETTVALLLATARRLPEAIEEARTGAWGTWSLYYMCGVGIYESTVGIVGLGRIGLSVAEKLKAFKPRQILYHNRRPNESKADVVGAKYVTLEELFKQSDFIVLTCAYSPEMKEMINKDSLKMMKKDAVLVNTSRGMLINQADLHEALKRGQIRAAGLDVTTPEPLPVDSPLFKLKNCVILPHIGSATEYTRSKMYQLTVDCILSILNGSSPPPNTRIV